ncbi:MAG: hypothetical protein M1820_002109 [Bogoriella megaspora]|nr:MAG: hypothetical protein M1820_002109 [Bogoriella megaspora]
MQPWCFVSPASRGIGFELAKLLLQRTNLPVVATARKDVEKAKESLLEGIEGDRDHRLTVLPLDVTDEKSIANASTACNDKLSLSPKEAYLHLGFCIPGILFPEKSPSQVDAENALLSYQTNTLGPLLMIKHFEKFLPTKNTSLVEQDTVSKGADNFKLPAAAVWASMSARVGSISDNRLGGWFSYRSSKAALNQITKTFDNRLQTRSGDKAMAVSLHPGTVKTGLSKEFWGNVKEEKLFTPKFAAERLLDVVVGLNIDGRGKCWDWEGREIPP